MVANVSVSCKQKTPVVRIAITTSMEPLQCLETLSNAIAQKTGIRVQQVVLPSAQALESLVRGDVSAAFAHAPEIERKFRQKHPSLTPVITLAGLLKPKRGQILFNSQPISRVNRHQSPLVYVHAQPYIFRCTVFKNLEMALFWARVPATQHARRIQETLDMFGLGKLADRRHYELSTGERQKVALGRAFVVNPTVVLFDEPSLGLGARSRSELVGYLCALREHNIGLVVTTHDPELKAALCLQTYTLHLTEELGGLRKGTLYENTRAS